MTRILFAFLAIYVLLMAAGCQQQESEDIAANAPVSENQVQTEQSADPISQTESDLSTISKETTIQEKAAAITMEDLQLGSLKLKMTSEQLSEKVQSQPVKVMPDHIGLQEIRFYEDFEIRLQENEVTYISTTSKQYATPKGLKVGDSIDTLLKLYGIPAQIYNNIYSYNISDEYYVFHAEVKDGKIVRIQVNLVC